jgi:hypothetical protein
MRFWLGLEENQEERLRRRTTGRSAPRKPARPHYLALVPRVSDSGLRVLREEVRIPNGGLRRLLNEFGVSQD